MATRSLSRGPKLTSPSLLSKGQRIAPYTAGSDQEGYSDLNSEPEDATFTPETSLSTASSPKKQPKCRDKHLPCPYDGCEKSFNRPARLEEHIRSHRNERIFKCPDPDCDKDFLRNTHLKRHIEANHTDGQKTYQCQYDNCRQSFVTNQRLKRHHAVHEKRDKYKCTEPGCGLSFRKHNTLDQHVRTVHRNEAAFPCDEYLQDGSICPRGFANAHYLKLHKGRDHAIASYFCTVCPKGPESSFGTFSDLQIHNKLVHPPTCETCGYTAKTTKEVAAHIQNKHSGDTLASRRKHICPFTECEGQGFVEKKNLKLHIKTIHEDQKPFQCGDISLTLNHVQDWDPETACGRAFSSKQTLENHIRAIHLGLDSTLKRASSKRKRSGSSASFSSKKYKPSTLDHLTGQAMTGDTRRTIACPILGCDFMFMREWDKAIHLQSRHGIPMDDDWIMTPNVFADENNDDGNFDVEIEETENGFGSGTAGAYLMDTRPVDQQPAQYLSVEEQLEDLARQGGQFWVGGLGEDEYQNYDNFEMGFNEMVADSDDEEFGSLLDPAL